MTTNLTVLQTTTGNPLNLHHTILKAAARRGIYFVGTEDKQFRLAKVDDPTLLSSETFSSTSEALEAFDDKQVVFETPKQEKNSTLGKCGVMNNSFHERYSNNPDGPGNGDDLDRAMRKAFHTKGATGKPILDVAGIKATCGGHNLWNPDWERLNPGFIRMNAANRMRAMLRNKPGNAILRASDGSILDEGRFGIECKKGA